MKDSTTGLSELNQIERPLIDGVFFDLGSIYEQAELLPDQRDPRGVRYSLALLLCLMLLAKLCSADTPQAVADWVRHRRAALVSAFQLRRPTMPGHSTFRRLGQQTGLAAEIETLLTQLLQTALSGHSRLISLDGKTLRGTWDPATRRPLHLLAAYVPGTGLVLGQVVVSDHENEIPAAARLLAQLALRGQIVMADAMHTQRPFAQTVLRGGADYILFAKDNQPTLRADIELLFTPEAAGRGSRPVPNDFRRTSQLDKGHGRLERRTLISSGLLHGYLDWPGVKQVFKLERVTHTSQGRPLHTETVYGLTSLSAGAASPAQLLAWTRQYWAIESGLHQRRDTTLHEDATRMRNPAQAHLLAALNNFLVGLTHCLGFGNLAALRRYFDAHIDQAFVLLTRPLKDYTIRL